MVRQTLANEIIYGDATSLQQYLRTHRSELNDVDEYGFVPIVEAAIANKTDCAQVLLRAGANVNGSDASGRNALHWAVDNGNYELTKLLLEHKADVNSYTSGGQPVLTYPILRRHHKLKNILYEYNANLDFALDFINTKLIGHRFELNGQTHIVDTHEQFIILDLEGFFLEFTLAVIQDSLVRYKNNFAAKHLRRYFDLLNIIIEQIKISQLLLRYRHYTIKLEQHEKEIDELIDADFMYLPLAYEGHAISCIKFANLFAICDRNPHNNVKDGIEIFEITRLNNVTPAFLKHLYFQKHSKHFIEKEMRDIMGLRHLTTLPISWQIAGNCSWANVEAILPALLFLISYSPNLRDDELDTVKLRCLGFYAQWREWDKGRALYDCVTSYYEADELRQASKAELLASVLTYGLDPKRENDIERAKNILQILSKDQHHYILRNFIKVYAKDNRTEYGKNILEFIRIIEPPNWFG